MIDTGSSIDGSRYGGGAFHIRPGPGWWLMAGGVEDQMTNRWKTWAGAFRTGFAPRSRNDDEACLLLDFAFPNGRHVSQESLGANNTLAKRSSERTCIVHGSIEEGGLPKTCFTKRDIPYELYISSETFSIHNGCSSYNHLYIVELLCRAN